MPKAWEWPPSEVVSIMGQLAKLEALEPVALLGVAVFHWAPALAVLDLRTKPLACGCEPLGVPAIHWVPALAVLGIYIATLVGGSWLGGSWWLVIGTGLVSAVTLVECLRPCLSAIQALVGKPSSPDELRLLH